MRMLFDSSALYKRYNDEPGRERVMALAAQASAVYVAAHCKSELASALNRQLHDGLIAVQDYSRIMAVLQREFADFRIQPLDRRVEALALAAMERARLRATDALHIGSAQSTGVDLFVTADRRQAAAAQAAGLAVELVEA